MRSRLASPITRLIGSYPALPFSDFFNSSRTRVVIERRARGYRLARSSATDLLFGRHERRAELNLSHLMVKSGLAISSADVDCGCSAFQCMAAVMRVRPLG